MKLLKAALVAAALLAVAAPMADARATGLTEETVNGCTMQFNRTGSDIVHQYVEDATADCDTASGEDDYHVVYRPWPKKKANQNSTNCESDYLIEPQSTVTGAEMASQYPQLAEYFEASKTYTVCVYALEFGASGDFTYGTSSHVMFNIQEESEDRSDAGWFHYDDGTHTYDVAVECVLIDEDTGTAWFAGRVQNSTGFDPNPDGMWQLMKVVDGGPGYENDEYYAELWAADGPSPCDTLGQDEVDAQPEITSGDILVESDID